MTRRLRPTFLQLLKNTVNRVAVPIARSGHGPIALVRHVGRRSGRTYETPLLLARTRDGFVAELTYGPDVDWYRNITAAGRCVVVSRGTEYAVDRIEPFPTAAGRAAFGLPASLLLRLLHRREFRLLHVDPASAPTVHRRVPPQRLITALNPLVRAAVRSPLHPLLDGQVVILHVAGRRTGRRYDIPVGFTDLGDRLVVLTPHRWRANLRGGAEVEITRFGRRVPMHADLDEDPVSVARTVHDLIARVGLTAARRRLGIVVDDDRDPGVPELVEAVRHHDLAIVVLRADRR
jgi:deazaflavin-dependent oxidoreductase (nitroreductase family)